MQRKHIQGAISVPLSLSDILYEVTFGGEEKRKKVIVYGGTFSKFYDWELADKLLHKGHKDVKVLEGGAAAWEKAGYPVETWEEKMIRRFLKRVERVRVCRLSSGCMWAISFSMQAWARYRILRSLPRR